MIFGSNDPPSRSTCKRDRQKRPTTKDQQNRPVTRQTTRNQKHTRTRAKSHTHTNTHKYSLSHPHPHPHPHPRTRTRTRSTTRDLQQKTYYKKLTKRDTKRCTSPGELRQQMDNNKRKKTLIEESYKTTDLHQKTTIMNLLLTGDNKQRHK